MKYLIKSILKIPRNIIYYVFNLFYLPYFYASCTSQLRNLSRDTQVFFITRHDFGPFITSLHYINCWQRQRGKTCVVILTSSFLAVKELAKVVCPNTTIIFPNIFLSKLAITLFGKSHVHYKTILPVFARLQIDNPNALYIYGQSSINKNNLHCSDHISHLDSSLSVGRKLFSPEFCLAYEDVRKILDYRLNIYIDSIDLHYNSDLSKPLLSFPKSLGNLKQHLRLPDKYVVFNVNLKKYNLGDCDRKRIHYPERYNCLIDSLIEKGYTVVIQGRKEQPAFSPRRGLIDYSKTPHISIENDISLYSGCQFAVISKSGPDNFTVACNVPLLGLNYVELPSMQANLKMRYFHKHVRDKKTGRLLSWQEFLKSPCYFDVCAKSYQDMEYVDMEEEEMLEALEEFIPLLSLSPDGWQNYTDLQKKFTASLHPMHLDLYYIKSAPCDCYLRRTMGNPC